MNFRRLSLQDNLKWGYLNSPVKTSNLEVVKNYLQE
jgi:hypothetical protein